MATIRELIHTHGLTPDELSAEAEATSLTPNWTKTFHRLQLLSNTAGYAARASIKLATKYHKHIYLVGEAMTQARKQYATCRRFAEHIHYLSERYGVDYRLETLIS